VTYSRPNIRQTDATPRVGRPDRGRILGGTPQITGDTNARVIDRSDPDLAGRNAGQDFSEFSAFLNDIIEPAVSIAEQLDVERANKQVGQLISDNPNLAELYANSPEEARAKIRSLSSRAQDLALERVVESATYKYGAGYNAAALSSKILSDPAREDEYAAEEAKLKSEWREKSGLSNLPPEYVLKTATIQAQVDGETAAQLDKARNKTKAQRLSATASEAYGKIWSDFGGWFESLDSTTFATPQEKLDAEKKALESLNSNIITNLRKALNAGDATPESYLAEQISGAQQQIYIALAEGDTDRAQGLLDAVSTASRGYVPINKTLNGKVVKDETNLWSLPVKGANGNSVSIESWIRQQDQLIERYEDKSTADKLKKLLGPALQQLDAAKTLEERQLATSRIDTILQQLPGEDFIEGLAIVTPTLNAIERETEEQRLAFIDLVNSDIYKGYSPEKKKEEIERAIKTGYINSKTGLNELRRIGTNETGLTVAQDIAQKARAANKSQGTDQALLDRVTDITVTYENATNSGTDNSESNIATLQGRAEAATAKIIAERQAQGESIQPGSDESRKIYSRELATLVGEYEKVRRDALKNYVDPAETSRKQLNEFIQAQVAGKSRLESFPESIKEEFKRNRPGESPTETNLLNYLISKLVGQQDADGNFLFGKDQAAVKNKLATELDRARKAKREGRRGFYPNNSDSSEDSGGYEGPSRPSDRRREKSEGEKADGVGGPSLPDYADMVFDSFGKIAGVVATPDQPAGLIENQEQIETMERMWDGREPPSLQTPPLPQVSAQAEVQPIPMAITTPDHPFFVAIGIAEGTRSADGSYTEPGRGTIGEGQSSQQMDKNWMGLLTQMQTQFSPVFRRMGIEPDTQGYNRLMFNLLDLKVQSSPQVNAFLRQLPEMVSAGLTIESIAKARADAFFDQSGRLEAPRFNNNYQTLYSDQRSRAGVWDYRRRL
jgi:hypothetical protein